MSRIANTTAHYSGVRLLGGALAFLLVCSAALLGGAQKPKVANSGYWYGGTQAPLVNVTAYPKDSQRSGELRWRFSGDSDDQPDQSFALEAYPHSHRVVGDESQASFPRSAARSAFSHYRPQAPRAPPAA